MRIAIITFSHFNTNYGSVLQALSLKMQLEKLGHDVEFIKYREFNNIKKLGIKQQAKNLIRKAALKSTEFKNKQRILRTEENFKNFRNKYLKETKLYTSNESLKNDLSIYDCYICGSDQIWNIDCLGGLRKPYFLDFAPKNKIKVAYAPSLGSFKIPNNELKEELKKLVENLDWISVREKESVKEIQELTDKLVTSVVDPVFLTSKEEWEGLLPENKIDKPYGVSYFVTRSKLGEQLVAKMKKKYNIPIYNLSDNLVRIKGSSNEFVTSDPLEFLALIKNAKFVVGTSFHLAAFSIIFNIPFLIAGLEVNKSRLLNVLDLVNCKENFVTELGDVGWVVNNFLEKQLDYSNLIEAQLVSKEFLIKAINNGK